MCSAQYQYRSAAFSHFEGQQLQLFVHVAVKKGFVTASAGVKSCFALFGTQALASVLQAASSDATASNPRFVLLTGMLRGTTTCSRRATLGRVLALSKKLDHHTLAVRVQKGSAACKEVACIIIAIAHPKRYVHQNWGCPHASRRDAHY